MDYKKLAKEITKEIGGVDNVQNVTHCATRLRFNLNNHSTPNTEKIKQLKGVTSVVESNNQYQVIIGPDVSSVYQELSLNELGKEVETEKDDSSSLISKLLDFIAGSFTPMIAVVAAGGMLQVLLSILELSGILVNTDNTYLVINEISQAAFFFIPIFLGHSVANRLKIDGYLGAFVGAIFVMPTLNELIMQEGGISLFGVNIPQASYGASVLPVLVSVWLMSYVYKFADRILPNAVKFILRPLVSIIILAPIALLFIGPLGVTVGNYVAIFLNYLLENFGPLAVMFMGAFAQIFVMTGMHTTFTPILLASLATYGYDSLIVPGMLIGLITQVGISLAAGIRAKNPEFKQLSYSASITALMGVTEPALYGVTLKLKKSIIGMIIAGAVGGLYFGLMNINTPVIIATAIAIPSYSNVFHTLIGLALAFTISFLYTWFIVKEEDFPGFQENTNSTNIVIDDEETVYEVAAPLEGRIIHLSDVPDDAFSSKALGKGIAITPTKEEVVAPFNGEVTAIFPGNHAIGLTSEDEIELLIHIGIDTVNLNGEGFKRYVEKNESISIGDKLLSFDKDVIQENNLNPVTMIVVTNTNKFTDILEAKTDYTNQLEKLLNIIK